MNQPLDDGPFVHGTKADLRDGDLLRAGFRSNYRPEVVMKHIYFTALPNGAGLAAELAAGDGALRVYAVEPTGAGVAASGCQFAVSDSDDPACTPTGRVKIGRTIISPAFWGMTANNEVNLALLDWVYSRGAGRVECDVDPQNHRSISSLKRFGFTVEGTRRRSSQRIDGS